MNRKLIPFALLASALILGSCKDTSSVLSTLSSGEETSSSLTTSGTITSTSDVSPSDPSIPDVNPGSKTFKEILEADYSNCTVYSTSKYKEDEDSYEVSTYNSTIYYYNNYSIVHNEMKAAQEYDIPYDFYHDYQGVNHMAFEKEGQDVWLSKGYNDVSLALHNTEFYLPDFLHEVNPDKVTTALGNFYITDQTEVARLNEVAFKGVWENTIQAISIVVTDGYITTIYGWEEGWDSEDDPQTYFVAQIDDIGETVFYEPYLPDAPNADNVMEYWEYKGWDGPEQKIYPISASLEATDPNIDISNVVNMEIDEKFEIVKTLDFDNPTGNYHYTKIEDVSYYSSNENVAKVVDSQYFVPVTDKYGHEVYNGTDGNYYSKGEGEVYYVYNTETETTIPEGVYLNIVNKSVFKKEIKAYGKGQAEIYMICSSAQDTAEFNVSPKYGVHSNSINVNVAGLAEIDKTNAVYNFDFISRTSTGAIAANNLVSGATANYNITSKNVKLYEGSLCKTNLFNEKTKNYLLINGASTTDGWKGADLVFDFDDQQVSKVDFYYGFFYDNDLASNIRSITLSTSNDGETWTDIDITSEIKGAISNEFLKLFTKEFEPSSKVKLHVETTMIGVFGRLTIDDVTFSKNASCHNHGQSAVTYVTSVTIQDTATVRMGNQISLTAGVLPNNATDKSVTWASSNESVATISTTGVITPVAPGTANITATSANGEAGNVVSNTCVLTVKDVLSLPSKFGGVYKDDFDYTTFSATIDATAMTMAVNYDGYEATLTLVDAVEEDRSYTFKNGNDVLECNFSGDGSSFYTSSGGKCQLNGETLYQKELEKAVPVTSITMSVSGKTANGSGQYELIAGDEVYVYANTKPTTANTGKDLTFTVSDPTIATYDEDTHKLTTLKDGTVTLTATSVEYSTVSASVTFVIAAKVGVTSLAITGAANNDEITVGQKVQLGYTVNPTNYNVGKFEWSTSDSKVIGVNKVSGLIEAKKVGEATIIVKDTVSQVTASITLTVKEDSGEGVPAAIQGTFNETYGSGIQITLTANSLNIVYDDASFDETYAFVSASGTTYTFEGGFEVTYNTSYIFVSGFESIFEDLYYVVYEDELAFDR